MFGHVHTKAMKSDLQKDGGEELGRYTKRIRNEMGDIKHK